MEPKYPKVKVKLVGADGNAFSIMANCSDKAKKAGVPKEEIDNFLNEAMSGDYNHLLRTCCKYWNCK